LRENFSCEGAEKKPILTRRRKGAEKNPFSREGAKKNPFSRGDAEKNLVQKLRRSVLDEGRKSRKTRRFGFVLSFVSGVIRRV
jgi:hypothetical protein